jgi:hypothetical protein
VNVQMLMEIALVSGVSALAYTIADHENVLPWAPNPEKKFWWERPPFSATPIARTTVARPTPQMTPIQKITMAQEEMARAQRQIVAAVQQSQEPPRVQNGKSAKYIVTAR